MTEKYANHVFTPVDTTLPIDHTQRIDELSGRQGDNMRTAYLQLMQTENGVQTPWNLGGYTVELGGKDAAGKVKLTNTATIMNPVKGLVALKIPAPFYQTAGQYQQAFLRILKENNVVSTVDVEFNVFENTFAMTTAESLNYIGTIDDQVKQLNSMISPLDTKLSTLNSASDTIESTFKAYLKEVQSQAVAKTGTDNTFTGTNTFNKTTHFQDWIDVVGGINAGQIYTDSGAWRQIQDYVNSQFYDSGFTEKGFSYLSGGSGSLLMRKTKTGSINRITLSGIMRLNKRLSPWSGWIDMLRIPELGKAANVQLLTRENPADKGIVLWYNLDGDKIQVQNITQNGSTGDPGWWFQVSITLEW